MFRVALVIAVAGCHATPPAVWPSCLQAEYGDHASGVRDLLAELARLGKRRFDREGNPAQIIDRDNRGGVLATTAIAWTPTTVREQVTGGPGIPAALLTPAGRGELGPHGELVRWTVTTGAETIATTLTWTGTFRDAPPRAAHEVPYLVFVPRHVPLDTRERHHLSRSRAFELTGSLELVETTQERERTRVTRHQATYDRGRLITLVSTPDGGTSTTAQLTWSATGLAVRVVDGQGGVVEHVAALRDDRIARWRSTATQQPRAWHEKQFAYTGGELTGYREAWGDEARTASLAVRGCSVQ